MTGHPSQLLVLMEDAVQHCVDHVLAGGLPFVGVVVDAAGRVSGFGVNRVHATGDPTAHAEIVAMREMQAATGRDDLAGAALLATGEPCGLCYRVALQLRVERVHVAVDAATVARWGFDYRGSYQALDIDPRQRREVYRDLPVQRALEPFEQYARLHGLGLVEPSARPHQSLDRTENMPWNGSTSR